jgi:hypothetical protein
VLAPKAFVYHVSGASFGGEKAAQKNRARAVLDRLYPEYDSLRRLLVEDAAMQRMRARVADVWLRGSKAGPRVLLTFSTEAVADLPGLVETLCSGANDVFVLVASGRQLKWLSCRDRKLVAIAETAIRGAPQAFDPWGDGYVDVVGRWLLEFAIEAVQIHCLRGHSARLGDLCAHLGLPLTVFIDDDYAICPSGSLYDELGSPCEGACTPTLGDCVETDPLGRRLKHQYVGQWQSAFARLLAQSSLVLVDSEIRRARLVDVLPGLCPEHIHVCNPSAPSWSQAQPGRSNATSRLRVGVLGIRQRDVIDRHLHNRVLSPLHHPILAQKVSPTLYDGAERLGRGSAEDLLIIAYEPSLLSLQVELIVEYVVRNGIGLVLDVACRDLVMSDAGSEESPLRLLLDHATDVWFSDEESARQAQRAHRAACSYIPTCLATDIWQTQRRNSSSSQSDGSRLLFIADSCSVADIDFVLEVISQIAEGGRHSLELVAVSRHRGWPAKPWLRHARIPDAAMSYPIFAAWLAHKGPFAIGLAGMADVGVASVAALEYAALGALPIAASIESTLMPLIAPDTPLVPGARVSDWVDTVTRVIGNRDAAHRHSTQVNEILRQRDIGVAARLIAKRLCRLR